MRAPGRLGLTVPVASCGLAETGELARLAEQHGYTDVWSSEVDRTDGFLPLAAAAGATSDLRLATGIVPAFPRPPALLAMTVGTLAQLCPGRVCLGLGVSNPTIVTEWMGQPADRPVARLRETVEALRLCLTGERVDYHGELVSVRGFRLRLGPSLVPIILAALGPSMLRLAGRVADGVMVNLVAPAALPTLLVDYWNAVDSTGRSRARQEVVQRVWVALDQDGDRIRQVFRRHLRSYGAVPAYNAVLDRQGFRAGARLLAQPRPTTELSAEQTRVLDDMVEQLFVWGSAADCRRRLAEFRSAGVTTLIVNPISLASTPERRTAEVAATIESVAGC